VESVFRLGREPVKGFSTPRLVVGGERRKEAARFFGGLLESHRVAQGARGLPDGFPGKEEFQGGRLGLSLENRQASPRVVLGLGRVSGANPGHGEAVFGALDF
jgi:hypothetical protein